MNRASRILLRYLSYGLFAFLAEKCIASALLHSGFAQAMLSGGTTLPWPSRLVLVLALVLRISLILFAPTWIVVRLFRTLFEDKAVTTFSKTPLRSLPLFRLIGETARDLMSPRRSIPIALITVALVSAQAWYARGHLAPVTFAVFGCLLTAWLGTACFRFLFFGDHSRASKIVAASICFFVLVFVLFAQAPYLQGFSNHLFTDVGSIAASIGLFVAGCFGLANDIQTEQNLKTQVDRNQLLMQQNEEARLLALSQTLDPHFLFNTLNAIAEWCREDAEVAERSILSLSRLLRSMLETSNPERWTLGKEIALVRELGALYSLRDAKRFALAFELDHQPDGEAFPPMLLLNIVENAFKHGPSKGALGEVKVSVSKVQHELHVSVSNALAEKVDEVIFQRQEGKGLPLLRARLKAFFGDQKTPRMDLRIEGQRAFVEIVLPERHEVFRQQEDAVRASAKLDLSKGFP